MLVASALCADRGLAAPATRAPVESTAAASANTSLAGRWIQRLSRSFSGAIAVELPRQARQPQHVSLLVHAAVVDQSLGLTHLPVSPFQFRLPPPFA